MHHRRLGEVRMKIIAKPVEMIASFTREGILRPIRYRLMDEDEEVVVNVDQVLTRAEEKDGRDRVMLFRCQSVVGGVQKVFELKFEVQTGKWLLWKM